MPIFNLVRRGAYHDSVTLMRLSREMEIVRLLSHGLTDVEIGAQVSYSPRTVQNHLTNIRDKTGLRRRSELARWAAQHAVA